MEIKDGQIIIGKASFNIEESRTVGKEAWLKTQHEALTPIGILEQVIPVIFPKEERVALTDTGQMLDVKKPKTKNK